MQKVAYKSKYGALERFTNSIHTPKTEKTYVYNLQQFLNYTGFTPERMLEIPKNSKDVTQNECFTIVQNYIQYLVKKKGLAPQTVNTFIAAIKLFFESNGVMLPFWTTISKLKGKREPVVIDRVYSKEEVKALLDHAGLRDKVIILILLSTGMRVGALAELKRKDIEYLPDYKIYKFIPYNDSRSSRYVTFCTPECAKELDKYLRHREEKEGERITDNSPVITHEITSSHRIKNKGFLSSQSIQQVLDRLRNEANVISSTKLTPAEIEKKQFGKIRKDVMRSHGFRKIFNNACIDNDVNHTVKEALMGHKTGMGLDVSYWRPETQKKLLNEYLKVVDMLTIDDTYRLKRENIELKKDREDINVLKRMIKEKSEEFDKLYDDFTDVVQDYQEYRTHIDQQAVITQEQQEKIIQEIKKIKSKMTDAESISKKIKETEELTKMALEKVKTIVKQKNKK